MALEILHDVIRVTNGDNTPVTAIIKDSDGEPITSGDMRLVIQDADLDIAGIYVNDAWNFEIPSAPEIKGRHMYHFEWNGNYLDFASAIYFE